MGLKSPVGAIGGAKAAETGIYELGAEKPMMRPRIAVRVNFIVWFRSEQQVEHYNHTTIDRPQNHKHWQH